MKDQHLESSIFGDSQEAGATSGGTGTDGPAGAVRVALRRGRRRARLRVPQRSRATPNRRPRPP